MTIHQTASISAQTLSNFSRFADRPAIADGTVSWTYRELADTTARYIAVLKSLGLGAGNALAILASNRAEVLAIMLASNLMGLRYTPIHPLGSEDDQAFVVDDAEIDVLVVEAAKFSDRAKAIQARAPKLKHLVSLGPMDGVRDLLSQAAAVTPAALVDECDPAAIAAIIYTGGTTGRPKGVVLGQRSLQSAMMICLTEWDWPANTRFLAATPISHAAGGVLRPVMYRGGYTRLLPGFDPELVCKTIEAERITAILLVPTILYALLDSPARKKYDLSSLQMVIYGAAPMSPDRLREAIEAFGPIFVQLYGQSEAPQCIATLRKIDHDLNRPERLGSCGLPSPTVDLKLFDADMNEVPVGAPGEICVRGPLVMDGYWKRPEATEEAFRGGWLHTGDVAIRDAEGYLTIIDRTKDMIISGGFNIYPREVEDALMSHEAVLSAAVVGAPDPKWGEAVTAFVVTRTSVDAAALQAHVKEKRGGPWTPKVIHFVEQIPVTGLGKIDRKVLRAKLWEGRDRNV
jgi:fatty-acyl-CoA synthase